MSSWVRLLDHRLHQRRPRALARALLDVPQLAHDVARRTAGNARHRAEPLEVRCRGRRRTASSCRRRSRRARRPSSGCRSARRRRSPSADRAARSVPMSSGDSMMRWPMGSVPPSGIAKKTLPWRRVFGTVSVSTTRIHGVHFIDEKYSAAALISSSVMSFAASIIWAVFGLRGSRRWSAGRS